MLNKVYEVFGPKKMIQPANLHLHNPELREWVSEIIGFINEKNRKICAILTGRRSRVT